MNPHFPSCNYVVAEATAYKDSFSAIPSASNRSRNAEDDFAELFAEFQAVVGLGAFF